MNPVLIQTLKERPELQTVHLNEQGDWLFFHHPSFPITKSREELLSEQGESESAETTTEAPQKKSKTSKK